MLTKIRHRVHGHLKLGRPLRFTVQNRKYALEVDERGYLSAIEVTAEVSLSVIPQVNENPQGPEKLAISVPPDPVTTQIRSDLRTVQGALAFFGLREIELDKPEQEWIPESAEEQDFLKLSKFSIGYGDLKDMKNEEISADIVVRCFATAELLAPYQTCLRQRSVADQRY